MNEILKTVCSLSLSGSLLMLALYAARPFYKKWLSKRWQYYIWLVVIARLLLPVAPENSLMGILFRGMESVSVQTDKSEAYGQAGIPALREQEAVTVREKPWSSRIVEEVRTDVIKGGMPSEGAPPALTVVWRNLWVVWLGGLMVLLIWKITVYHHFVSGIRSRAREVTDISLQERYRRLLEAYRVKKEVKLCIDPSVSTPLLFGFRHPCIALPDEGLPEPDFTYTVLHELTHYKRYDMYYNWLIQVTICIHWWNPLVWRMGRQVSRACELSCDESVIRYLDPQGRRAYGETLLNAVKAGGGYRTPRTSMALNEGKELLKERLRAIKSFGKGTRVALPVVMILTGLLLAGGVLAGAYLSGSSWAEPDGTETAPGGNGEPEDQEAMETLEFRGVTYYLVFTEDQLRSIGTGDYGLDQDYMQQADIQLSSTEWIPIGTWEAPFTGSYNGNGYEIRGLTMTSPDAEIIGMFGVAEKAHIYNITLQEYDIWNAGSNVKGKSIAPVLAFGDDETRCYDNYVYPVEDQ